MSGWSFLSKAEGFLDRVLEEQSKERSKKAHDPSELKRTTTPAGKWQERLTKVANQFASADTVDETLVAPAEPGRFADDLYDSHVETEPILPSASLLIAPVIELTELQQSAIFPANMPSHLSSDLAAQPSNGRHTLKPIGSENAPTTDLKPLSESQYSPAASIISRNSSLTSVQPAVFQEAISFSHKEPKESNELLREDYKRLEQDLQQCEARRLEEMQSSAERISALESRLAYFSNEQISTTSAVAKSSAASSFDKILAEKDRRIALLLGEGDLLSKKELQNTSNAKKLRTRITELEGLIATSLKAVEKADDTSVALKKENQSVQENLKRSESKVKELQRFEIEVADLKREKQAQMKVIADLNRQLTDADETISQNVTVWTQLQAEKGKTSTLQTQIGSLLLEAKATAEENASDLEELQGRYNRFVDRSDEMKEEKDTEIHRLEGEIEELRARLEESTTSTSELSQTKLLRQIEALQTQYALARQNWARIEESLMLRSNHAERERDELRVEEDALRTRLRKLAVQKKTSDEEKSALGSKLRALETQGKDLEEQKSAIERKRREIEVEMEQRRLTWLAEKESIHASIETRVQDKLAEERSSYISSQNQSPFLNDAPNRAPFSFQHHIPDSPQHSERSRPNLLSRRSNQTSRVPQRRTTPSMFSMTDELQSVQSPPPQSLEDEILSPSVSSVHLRAPTEISVSTLSASTNIGIIERVTANARKLELEMQILREDLTRVTRQRDEAMEECVSMESLREEITELKRTHENLLDIKTKTQSKFEATLDLLGEQTEENEQLKEDIVDMRKMLSEISASKVK